jgi:putative component of membrane protein insertase Oxa1/YidC/SpoIIIJ protein YidD
MENQISHVLNALCAYNPNCQQLCLYQKNGLAIAITSLKKIDPFKKGSYATIKVDASNHKKIKTSTVKGRKYFQALQAICLEPQHNTSSLFLIKDIPPKNKVIGYLLYTFRE